MSLLIMQHPTDYDLEEIESHLYSQVFHSTENWDQTPDHPVLNKVPERHVTTYSINHTANSSRYWDGTIQGKKTPSLNENAISNSSVAEKTTENTTKSNEINDINETLQNKNDKNVSRKVGLVEEYIGLDSTNNQNPANRNDTNIDFSKDDFHGQQSFFHNSQDKLIQQMETPNNLNNNTFSNNQCDDFLNPFADLKNKIKLLEQENTVASIRKAGNLTMKLKHKEIKHARQMKRLLKEQAKEEKRWRKLGLIPNDVPPFSFVKQFNNIQRKPKQQNFAVDKSPVNSNRHSPISPIVKHQKNVKQTEINESAKNQQETIANVDDTLVILSDSDSDSDAVIEVPLPAEEIVCIDSSSEISDIDDTAGVDENIVENIPKTTTASINHLSASPKTPNSISEENTVSSPKYENSNGSETIEIKNKSQLISEGEIINNTKAEQITNNKQDKIEVMKDVEENATTLSENEEKIDKTKSPKQTRTPSKISINEIEKERAELLCTPDSNTNDFMANDVCNLNKSNFSFNFNLHDSDLGMSGKEIPKAGPSITDVYETESSCSEAGTASKNQSYFNEVDFESPIKEIFAEPDLAKFSSFITPIRNRNISNVANSTPDLTPIKTKAGVVNESAFKLNLFNKDVEGSCSSDEYNSDPTTLPVKKKIKKKKKKAKKKDNTEITKNTTDDNVIPKQTETSSNTELVNKPKKNKKRRKAITYEELKQQCLFLNQSDCEEEKISKTKEKKLKKKNKRKSDQLEHDKLSTDLSNKKLKNVANMPKEKSDLQTKQNEENKKDDISCETATQNTNKDNIESRLNKNLSEPLEELNSVEYYDKVDTYFADDILYKELENKPECSSNNLKKNENQVTNNKDSSYNEQIDIDTLSSNSDTNIGKISFTNTFQKEDNNETQTIEISSDSDTEISQPNEENTSSNSGNNIVLNIFSPEKSNNDDGTQNIVANPFSFVQNFEKLNHKKGFKDYYTNDMKTFYNESWGHENYDITAVQQSMPSEFSKWSVNTADQFPLRGKKRGPMCLRCREFGHLQFRCPKLHEVVKCSTCGDLEHTTTRCPKSICTTCRSSTQHHTTSCNNCSNYQTIRCPICHYIGHLSRDCPDLWRRYHLTTNDNNSLVVSNKMLKPPNMLWCSNCANPGHSANNCNYLRTDHFPTYPGILNYTPVYNTVLETPPEPQIPVRIFENVNLSQIRNHRMELVENNNKKYLNMIKNLRRHIGKSDDNMNLNNRLNYLQNAANSNRFNKQKIGELYRISKILRSSR